MTAKNFLKVIILILATSRLSTGGSKKEIDLSERSKLESSRSSLRRSNENATIYRLGKLLERLTTLKDTVSDFAREFPQMTNSRPKAEIQDWLKKSIQKKIDSRFGNLHKSEFLDEINQFLDIGKKQETARRLYFKNMDNLIGDVLTFHILENFFHLPQYSVSEFESIQFTRDSVPFYVDYFKSKNKNFLNHFGFAIPDEIKRKVFELENLSKALDELDERVRVVFPNALEKLWTKYHKAKLMITRVVQGAVLTEEDLDEIEKRVENQTDSNKTDAAFEILKQEKFDEKLEEIRTNVVSLYREIIQETFQSGFTRVQKGIFSKAFNEFCSWSLNYFDLHIDNPPLSFFYTSIFRQLLQASLAMGEPLDKLFERLKLFVKLQYDPKVNEQLYPILKSRLSRNPSIEIAYSSGLDERLFVIDLIRYAEYSKDERNSESLFLNASQVETIIKTIDRVFTYDLSTTLLRTYGDTKLIFDADWVDSQASLPFLESFYAIIGEVLKDKHKNKQVTHNEIVDEDWNRDFDDYLNKSYKNPKWKHRNNYFLFKVLNFIWLSYEDDTQLNIGLLTPELANQSALVLESSSKFDSLVRILRVICRELDHDSSDASLPLNELILKFSGRIFHSNWLKSVIKKSVREAKGINPIADFSEKSEYLKI